MDFVYFLRFEWDNSFRRPYHFELSRHGRVLCVESPVTADWPLRDLSTFRSWLSRGSKLRQVGENLYLFRPFTLVCYFLAFHLPFLVPINRWLLARSLGAVVQRLKMHDLVVFINHPMMEYVIGVLGERVLCYEVFDEYIEEYGMSRMTHRRMQEIERRVLGKATVVFTSSRLQMESRQAFAKNIHVVPNAVEVEFFMKALSSDIQIPEDVREIHRPRLGFVGNMTPSVDVKLLRYLVDMHPEWSLFIIGKRDVELAEAKDLLARPNVYYLGFKNYNTLPAYIKGLDVGLLPYVLDARTRTVYPNKLHQYLAGGKPVVSTAMPELESFKNAIGWARNFNEFERMITLALKGSLGNTDKGMRIAQENSIAARTAEKIQILRAALRRTET